MIYRRLGRTGLGVSPIALGTMGFGPPTTQIQANRIVRAAIDLGINLVDTANCYDGPNRGEVVLGTSELMLGKALAGRRDEVVLVTKAGVPLRSGPQNRGLSATHLIRELEASLRRLQTDWVDVFMIHWPDAFADVEEVLRAIETLVKAGKARYFGVSNHQGWEICEYLWEADKRCWPKVGVSEIPFSILERKFENDLPFYARHEVGVICYQPLKAGLLSGRHRQPSEGKTSKTRNMIAGWKVEFGEDILPKLDALTDLAAGMGATLAQFSLSWVISQTAVTSAIVGAQSLEQLKDSLKAIELEMTDEVLQEIDQVAPGPVKPVPRFER